jgi:hypothetical protein
MTETSPKPPFFGFWSFVNLSDFEFRISDFGLRLSGFALQEPNRYRKRCPSPVRLPHHFCLPWNPPDLMAG